MAATRLQALLSVLKSRQPGAVLFSGGVDSTLLLALAQKAWNRSPLAVSFLSPLMTAEEKAGIGELAQLLGTPLKIFQGRETRQPIFRRNPPDRCYHCKKSRFQQARPFLEKKGLRFLLDGTNADDLSDYRPGLKANREFGIVSPLADLGWTKTEIRKTARRLGLPNWDRPSAACLASRIPYGDPVTPARLKRIAAGEEALKKMGLREYRLRSHGTLARIEVREEDLGRLLQEKNRRTLIGILKNLDYRYLTLDLEGLRSGSLNEGLAKRKNLLKPL
ncbi:MAG: ATP-dependent sacrificial sulfur transferase LarE [Deltaproteobacteria bacterium]|nr:ATP-dependent sacrificial sulfur transferase LarE [Deltaproteobacteria bacterium]